MTKKFARLLDVADRVAMNLQHKVPPEAAALEELRELITEFRSLSFDVDALQKGSKVKRSPR
jgi:hypothetical protein